jgi:hypothetical protein
MATITKFQPRPNTYRVDNIIVDEYAEKIGAIGVAIYNVLARHADRQTGICYPSIGTIAKKLKLGRTTVKKYLRILLKYSLIAISARLSDEGDPTSNLYMLLDPSPEQMALRRRKLEALLTPQHGTFIFEGGRSPDDPPPGLSATDPQSPADLEQSSSLNKNIRTNAEGDLMTEISPQMSHSSPVSFHKNPHISMPTEKQKTCPHPPELLVFLPDNITICHHCYGLLDENLKLVEEDKPARAVSAA